MPWNPKRYHPNYKERSRICKDLANWQCEQCGIADGTWRIGLNRHYKEVIQTAHLDHDIANPNARLMAMCQDCHLKYDALEHGRNGRQTKYRKRREAEIEAGQLELFIDDDIEEQLA